MSARRLWFGNRRRMQWVKPFAAAPEYAPEGYEAESDYLNGGAEIDASVDSHAVFNYEWTTSDVENLRFLGDYANGLWGKELYYWTDPMYAPINAVPPSWSMPWLAAEDAMPLCRRARPEKVANTDFSYNYPAFAAKYTVLSTDVSNSIMIPIPPGYTAWVGLHGDSVAAGLFTITPYEGMTAGSPVHPTALGVNTATRVNTSFNGTGQSWIKLSFMFNLLPAGTPTEMILNAIMVQILPTGQTPATGDFMAGRGHSGAKMVGRPKEKPLSAALGKTTVAAKFLEVGTWL